MLFRTAFVDNFDLVQKFRGFKNDTVYYNAPIDFAEAGLIDNRKWDFWHLDVPFNVSNDEAVPLHVNGSYIGANHGHFGAVQVYSPNHNITFEDIGKTFVDGEGTTFTLYRVVNEDYLQFLSENVGKSINEYKFKTQVCKNLKGEEKTIEVNSCSPTDFLRTNRYKRKAVIAYRDGEAKNVITSTNCDYAEIIENYEIINPATVMPDLSAYRSKHAFTSNPNMADFGTPMLDVSLVYRINADGTVLCIYELKALLDVSVEHFFGAMYQEKLDVYGGGIYRYMPKLKPLITSEGIFDFSSCVPLALGKFPDGLITREFWEKKDSPPERIVDFFRSTNGKDKLAFACGYLPIHDGKNEIRAKNITSPIRLTKTRKAYPVFSENFTATRGVAYKKFFTPFSDGASVYSVDFEGKTYLFFDLIQKSSVKITTRGKITLYEKSDEISHLLSSDGQLTVSGEKGFAIFLQE